LFAIGWNMGFLLEYALSIVDIFFEDLSALGRRIDIFFITFEEYDVV
jgi:hypothetical protein